MSSYSHSHIAHTLHIKQKNFIAKRKNIKVVLDFRMEITLKVDFFNYIDYLFITLMQNIIKIIETLFQLFHTRQIKFYLTTFNLK